MLAKLPAAWRSRADQLERYAASAAEAFRTAAGELDAALRESENESLTLQEAARESGYSERRLRELLASRDIPNAGRKGRPRIRRGDVPRKAVRESGGFDPAAEARDVLRAS